MIGDVLQFCNCMIAIHASCGLTGWSACQSVSASATVPKLTWDNVYVVKCLVQSPEHRHDYGYLIISIYFQRIHRLWGWHNYTLALTVSNPIVCKQIPETARKAFLERLPAAQHPLKVCENRLSCLLAVTEIALCLPISSSLPPHWQSTGFTLAADVCPEELHFWPPSGQGGPKLWK